MMPLSDSAARGRLGIHPKQLLLPSLHQMASDVSRFLDLEVGADFGGGELENWP